MSLILEALKKIERDKQAPERGVVVLASSSLAAPPPRSAMPVAGLVAGGVAIAATLGWMFLRPAPSPAPAATVERPLAKSEAAPAPIALAPVVPITIAPARPAAPVVVAPPSTLPALHLTAIGSRDGQPVAVINDQVLQVGDSVGNARVVAIDATSVELEIDGVRRRITF